MFTKKLFDIYDIVRKEGFAQVRLILFLSISFIFLSPFDFLYRKIIPLLVIVSVLPFHPSKLCETLINGANLHALRQYP